LIFKNPVGLHSIRPWRLHCGQIKFIIIVLLF